MPYLITYLDETAYPPRVLTHGTVNCPNIYNSEREAIERAKQDFKPDTKVALAYINPKRATVVKDLEPTNG